MTKLHMSVAIALAALLLILTYFLTRDGEEDAPEIADTLPSLPVQETTVPEAEEEEQTVTPELDEADSSAEEAQETGSGENEGDEAGAAPVVEEEPEPEPEPLPDLNDSDSYVYDQISTLDNRNDLLQRLTSGQLIRKFVMLVDNVSRGQMPARDLPILGPSSEFEARETGLESYEMSAQEFSRYDELVQTMTAVDTAQAVMLYEQMVPLFEQAYAELGYADSTFQEALNDAFDQVLEAEVTRDSYDLTLPSVHYEFADPELEALSSIEKLLLRMGPENAAALQDKLREIRAQLNL